MTTIRISGPLPWLADGHADRAQDVLDFYAAQPTLARVLLCACEGKVPTSIEPSRQHSHWQKNGRLHWTPQRCNRAAVSIGLIGYRQLRSMKTFHELWTAIVLALSSGPDPICMSASSSVIVYDIALFVGAWLELSPDRIYLHAGTRRGAEAVLGRRLADGATIQLSELVAVDPAWKHLTPDQAEDALCALGA